MLSAVALLIIVLALLAGTAPSLMGYEGYVVLSGSMEPAIGVGDLSVVAPTKPEEMMVGDVITYRTNTRPDLAITHRLVGISLDEQGQFSFQTKGDANTSVDQVTVTPGSVLGRVTYTIPKLGYLVEFSKRPEGKVALIGIPGLLLALDYLLRRRRPSPEMVSPRNEVEQFLARGRIAYQNGAKEAAIDLFDQAIASDPHLEEAWVLKAQCQASNAEQLSVLRAGLTVNPRSARLRDALEGDLAREGTTG